MTGVPGPILSPEFAPVIESTELGRSLPRRVASAMASRISRFITIWFAPTGVLISKVGMPVSWQIGPSLSQAMSMFVVMTASAVPALVAGFSSATASAIALRTSGGRLVEVSVTRLRMLSLNDSMANSPATIVRQTSGFLNAAPDRVSDKLKFVEPRRRQKASLSPLTRNKKGGREASLYRYARTWLADQYLSTTV